MLKAKAVELVVEVEGGRFKAVFDRDRMDEVTDNPCTGCCFLHESGDCAFGDYDSGLQCSNQAMPHTYQPADEKARAWLVARKLKGTL